MSSDPTLLAIMACGVAAVSFWLGSIFARGELKACEQRNKMSRDAELKAKENLKENEFIVLKKEYEIGDLENSLSESRNRYKALRLFVDETLRDWKKQSVLLPNLREWSDRLQVHADELIESELHSRGAWRAAEQVKKANKKARELKRELDALKPQLGLYESLAPWLYEYSDLTVEEILEGVQEERQYKEALKSGKDPVEIFVPRSEWKSMSEAERNQLALDRYWHGSRRRTAWTAGIQYERFIGYAHEKQGFEVVYHGAMLGLDDLGIDLVCRKGEEVRIVQCKRLSPKKGVPVRENVIAQVYGASRFYEMEQKLPSEAIPVLYTSYECSNTARAFAEHLGVKLFEKVQFKPYPCIKCNISQSSHEKIYHLPFDQKYDATVIGDMPGEFYAMTVSEAEEAGFRRAFRWSGA